MAGFGAVYGPNSATPRITQSVNATSGATFLTGAVLIMSAGEVTESAADPVAATIVGVAAAPAGGAPGYSMANQPAVVTFRVKSVPIYLGNGNVFKGNLTNGSSVTIAPVIADNLAQYGITAYSGVWVVDKAKTGASARVVIEKIDTDNNEVYFRFIESFTVEI